jgi:hypothetical protein
LLLVVEAAQGQMAVTAEPVVVVQEDLEHHQLQTYLWEHHLQ